MRKILLVAALFMAAAMPAFAQTTVKPEQNNSVEQAVLKLTQEWLEAEVRVDRAALNRIIADDFLGTGPRGTIVSKTDVIPREGSEGHGLAISGQDIKVRVFGDTAIVTGRGVPKVQDRPELRITVVFVKRADRWQMVAGHLSAVPPNSDQLFLIGTPGHAKVSINKYRECFVKEPVTKRDIWYWLFPEHEYNTVTMNYVEEAGTDTKQDWTFARLIVLIVPVTATANVLGLWLSPPVAYGISTFGWTLLLYWFPSKPRVSYVKWILLSLLLAIVTSLLAIVM